MNIEQIRDYCLAKNGVSESMPFGDDTLVFKVMDKIFAMVNLEGDLCMNLKCDPQNAIELREEYSFVIPGRHMNKKYWNTVMCTSLKNDQILFKWIDDSYILVIDKLTNREKAKLDSLKNKHNDKERI